MERIIFHCDCNSFYASVELLGRPELHQKPVAVAGDPENRHGIILAKNEPAKRCGVQTAETIGQARRKCPNLVLLPPHHREYRRWSEVINAIYDTYTDRVEPFGIDESWLDMSGSWQLFGKSPEAVAHRLRREVKQKTGLTISVGVSYNKVFAKLASDYKKPDAVTIVSPQNYTQVVWPLPVGALLYVGRKSGETLGGLGIETIGQLAEADPELLAAVMGKQGPLLVRYARGEDDDPVRRYDEQEPVKSVGNGMTFRRNLLGMADLRTATTALAEEVGERLRRHGLFANSLQVQIRDPEFKTISRQKPLPYSTNTDHDLIENALTLIKDNWKLSRPIRALTITAQTLSETPQALQTSLWEQAEGPDPRRRQLSHSLDKIREKYGAAAVTHGSILNNDIGLSAGEDPDDPTENPDDPTENPDEE